MSASAIGSSGSSYGASSFSSSLGGGSGSALTTSILGAVSLAGENVALFNQQAPLVTQPAHAPLTAPTSALASLSGGSSTWVVLFVLAIVAFFAYREL